MTNSARNLDFNKAYLIHSKDFRETSLLIDFFTEHHGFIKAVARGVRRTSKNNKRGILQPFTPLLINWYGNSELVSLSSVELSPEFTVDTVLKAYHIPNSYLAVGFYLNELLYYLLNKYVSLDMQNLFYKYVDLISFLKSITEFNPEHDLVLEIKLREFELDILTCIGFGLQFNNIKPDLYYGYAYDHGFYWIPDHQLANKKLVMLGKELLALKQRDWSQYTTLLLAKKLLRLIIQYHIGNKEFHSRKLYIEN